MLAAEWLAATKGLGGLSAREIATEAKLKNNVSVQYHFGSTRDLLRELVQMRMAQLDSIRSDMIAKLQESGDECDVRALVDIICLPHLVLARREGGRATYAAFLCQYLPSANPAGFDWVMGGSDPKLPALNWIFARLQERLPTLPAEIFNRRMTSASLLFLNVVQGLPPEALSDERLVETSVVVQDALRQSTAVLLAPTGP
jgi:AcrR family transcriptional regulator